MTKLTFVLAALAAITPFVTARPQGQPIVNMCEVSTEDYEITDVLGPYLADAEPVGAASCMAGVRGGCQHQKGHEHSVGITKSISGELAGGLDVKQIFTLGASLGYQHSWSKEDTTTVSSYVTCPEPKKGTYICGMQVRPQKVKTKGKVHRYFPKHCGRKDPGWVDYEVVAPALSSGGPNSDSNELATFGACVISCPDKADGLDCDGVKSAMKDNDLPLCPETKSKKHFEPGWCTAHITQHQRWQKGLVGDKFMFSLEIFDGKSKSIYKEHFQEVNDEGLLSIKSKLPHALEIKTTSEDKDFVQICYNGECWWCDDANGGGHGCSLGDGKELGYENNKREGDFGFTC